MLIIKHSGSRRRDQNLPKPNITSGDRNVQISPAAGTAELHYNFAGIHKQFTRTVIKTAIDSFISIVKRLSISAN
jgi:hypothetical protein